MILSSLCIQKLICYVFSNNNLNILSLNTRMAIPLFFVSAYIYCCLVKNRKCSRPIRNKPSICFSGCGLRYHFYGGVAEYLLDNFETDNIDILCVS